MSFSLFNIDETVAKSISDYSKKTSRAEDILEIIKQGIILGYWKPNDKIDDLELSEKLGVSRLTVRDALSKLAERRIVEKKYWKGYSVRRLTWDEIDSLIDVRLALEELALRSLFRRIKPETIAALKDSLEKSRRSRANNSYREFFQSDYVFHQIISRESGNLWIPDILADLHILISIVRFISQSDHVEQVAETSILEHERIVAEIEAGRCEQACEALRVHLNNHRERVRMEYAVLAEKEEKAENKAEPSE